jgi:hypothetical protein
LTSAKARFISFTEVNCWRFPCRKTVDFRIFLFPLRCNFFAVFGQQSYVFAFRFFFYKKGVSLMRQIFLACLFACFIFFTAQAQTLNQANLLKQILDLPAPAPVEETKFQTVKITTRADDFYDKNKIPPDDAPIEDLVQYWSKQSRDYRQLRYNVKPSEKTLERLLEFCAETPDAAPLFLNIFPTKPEIAESVKRIYDKLIEKEAPEYLADQIKNWLVYHSNYYVEELVKKAEKVKDKNEYVTNQTELLALTRVDWDKASPILERLINDQSQPVSSTLAKWAFYAHALETGDENDISKYRRGLQDVVEDKKATPGARDLAFDSLVSEKEWDGRDEWYLTLLQDETLYELRVNGSIYTGLTTLLLYSPPEKYAKTMAAFVENKNPAIRRAAIKNLTVLLNDGNIEAVRALLPWLSNPNWVSGVPNGRAQLIVAVGKVDLPEAVPALITILINEEEFRQPAAEALTRYKDPRAVPALKIALAAEKSGYRRTIFIHALDECGGLSDDEKMASLELYAEAISTPEGLQNFFRDLYGTYVESEQKPQNPMAVALNIGNYVSQQTEPGDGLVMRAISRLKTLRKTKPAVAATLANIMQKWRGRVIFIERLRQIREGEADLDTILTALAQRGEIRERIESEVFAMRAGGGIARGIAPCLLEDEADFQSVLRQTDADAQITMLGCARLLRAKLPVREVSVLMKNANKTLALAAERYLETEDSVEARTLVLERHPAEAVILGARQAFIPDPKNYEFREPLRQIFQTVTGRGFFGGNFPGLDKSEENLRGEIKSNPDLLAVYGILPNKSFGQQVIRVFKDKIVFTNYEDTARYREKTLTAKEYEDFYRLILQEKIDSTAPSFNSYGDCEDCEAGEFVMFGKNGGRRVFFTNGSTEDSPIKKIFERFASFNEGNLKLHYRLADKINGLEVLLADENLEARAVWKNGSDFRVLIEDKEKEAEIQKNLEQEFEAEEKIEDAEENYGRIRQQEELREKRREESRYAHFFWRSVENGTLGGILTQPAETPYLYDETQFPETNGIDAAPRAWQVRAGNYEIRSTDSEYEEAGLYKVSRSQPPVKFKEGDYDLPVVTPDGNWVVVTKAPESWGEPLSLVRINLRNGKEFPVNLPPAGDFKAIAFVASNNKMLIRRAKRDNYYYRQNQDNDEDETEEVKPAVQTNKDDKDPSPQTPEYYLLDAVTGATQPVKGEFRPLEDMTYRPLQQTSTPNEFWAAIYDRKAKETAIGRYNTKTFTFQAVIKLPEIKLDSMDIWIDEKEARIYFVYQGHLLAVPLQNPQK